MRRVITLLVPLTLWLSSSLPVGAAESLAMPRFDRIVVIVMENQSFEDLIDNPDAPFINALAAQYGLALDYSDITHPSLPNYLALTGGDTFGTVDDCTDCFVDALSIIDRIEASGRKWKAYMEDMPSACFVGDAYPYVQHHNPFIYYDRIRNDPARCDRIVPYSELAGDLANATTAPNYIWVTPNMCSDMHDCPISDGDTWLSEQVPAIMGSPAFTAGKSLLVLTWDEGSFSDQVVTIFAGASVRPAAQSAASYDHYSLLRTIEHAWGLAPLTSNDGSTTPMTDLF